jgi:hypothetical protein
MTQEFINKVEYSFSTLAEKNGKFGIFDEAVKEVWENDPEKDQILETVYKILDLFNNSNPEQQKVLYNSEVSDVIKMVK